MAHTIGENVRKHRARLAWTQEHLALAAKLSTRTVQRIGEGVPASADSLLAIAGALDVSIDDLRRTPAEQAQLDADAAEAFRKVEERYRIVRLERIERASGLSPYFARADALLCEHVELGNDDEEDATAEFEGCLREGLDFWAEIPPTSRREAEKDLQRMIEGLHSLGFLVAAAINSRRLRLMSGEGEPVVIHTLYVMISRAKEPKLSIALERKAPVQFTA